MIETWDKFFLVTQDNAQEKGRYYLSRKFELQILNISRVIMSEMWKIGLFKNPRKMALCFFCIY